MSIDGSVMNGRDALLEAFGRLFDRAAAKLRVECSADEKERAKRQFAERFAGALEVAGTVEMPGIPEPVMQTMETAIDGISPAQLVGHLASIPLAQQTQALLRRIAYQAAEHRVLEHLAGQADERYGGN